MKKTAIITLIVSGVLLLSSFASAEDKTLLNKTAAGTKSAVKNTAAAAKSAAKKTAAETKNITQKTADETKNIIDDIFAYKEVTAAGLAKQSSLKTLKTEKKALKAAYNSRIKDTKAKIKSIQKSSVISNTQKQNKIYMYEKQILDLEEQRDSAVKKYDFRIKQLKNQL